MPKKASPARRRPQQTRAKHTVEAVLDAVTRVLKKEGAAKVTTNRIARLAGVSIGSVYQYFPDKQAIFVALRARHVERMATLVERKLVENAAASLDELLGGVIDALVEAHALDPALYAWLLAQLPSGSRDEGDFERRLHGALRLALSARAQRFKSPLPFERILFALTPCIESLAHAVVLERPASLSLQQAKEEAVRVVSSYVRSYMK